jgi:hypothetical protein
MLSPHEFATLMLVKNASYQCDLSHEDLDALPYTSGSFEDSDHATLTLCVKDGIELHAVCDIFSRLGTVDIDAAKLAA